MNKIWMSAVIFLTLFCATRVSADAFSCAVNPEVPKGDFPLRIADVSLMMSKTFVSVDLNATNASPHTVVAVLLLAELRDANHKLMFSIPIYSRDSSFMHLGFTGIPQAWLEAYGGSIGFQGAQNGERIKLYSKSPVTSTICPSTGRISIAKVAFSDGSVFEYAADDWEIQPVLAKAGYFPKAMANQSFRMQLAVDVSADGAPSIRPVGEAHVEAAWLSNLMSHWEFVPAIKAGRSYPGTIQMVFQLELEQPSQHTWEPSGTLGVFSFVRAVQHRSLRDQYLVLQGESPVTGGQAIPIQ